MQAAVESVVVAAAEAGAAVRRDGPLSLAASDEARLDDRWEAVGDGV